MAPAAQPSQVTCSGVTRASTDFWMTTAIAYANAATISSAKPSPLRGHRTASPITTTPARRRAAGKQPAREASGEEDPARMAIRIGPVLITMAGVPASTCCSAAFSVKLSSSDRGNRPRSSPGRSELWSQRASHANAVNYVETDGHVVMNDETGGKPETGYGSGQNSGSPIATPEETAAMIMASVARIMVDFNAMCRSGGGYAFDGAFCQSMAREGLGERGRASVLTNRGEWGAVLERYVGACVVAGIQGAVLASGGGATAVAGAAVGCLVAVTAKGLKSKGKGTNAYAAGQVLDLGSLARDIRTALVKATGAKGVPSVREIIRMYREAMSASPSKAAQVRR